MNSLIRFPHRVRIHGGECGAVARALHHKAKINSLPAVSENVLLTTIERKSMSTKTNFKRVALGVIAALGFGMLSVAPSSATISEVAISTPTAGAATYLASATSGAVMNDTTTAASFTVSGLLTTTTDTITVRMYANAKPTLATTAEHTAVKMSVRETTTANTYVATAGTTANGGLVQATFNKYNTTAFGVSGDAAGLANRHDSVTVGSGYDILGGGANGAGTRGSDVGRVGATFNVYLESGTSYTAGTYTYDIVVTAYSNTGSAWATTTSTTTVSIVVAAAAATTLAAGKLPQASGATAFLGTSSGPTDDAVVRVVSTASTTAVGHIRVTLQNTNGDSGVAEDSLTATVSGPGLICDGSVCGKELRAVALTSGVKDFTIRADGTAGIATITITSTVATFAAKTVTFYAKAAKTITALTNAPVINVGANSSVILATAVDADGNTWAGTAYIYATSAANALIAGSETPSACSWSASLLVHVCSVTGKLPGTGTFKIIDASTVALATATSNEVSTRVSTGVATTAKLSFDKATYAPGEKAQVRVQVLDGAGLAMPAKTISAGFTAAIESSRPFHTGSATFQETITLAAATSATSNTNAGHMTYVVYMPLTSGVVTITATGSTGLALAGRVDLSATATVVNNDPAIAAATAASEAATDAAAEAIDAANAATDAANLAAEAADAATVAAEEARDAADAATAAVEELATQVATLMAALKAQITTLANTVAKIAKKVKA
jgi:hypothetical protein